MRFLTRCFLTGLIASIVLPILIGSTFAWEYEIKPNDIIKTSVFDNSDLNVNFTVPPDGLVSFPLVGEIPVLGKTSRQLEIILAEKLAYYLKEPKVTVQITAYNPLKIYILGSVREPGAYDYKPENRLTDYLSEAGGFDPLRANLKHCYIFPADKSDKIELNLKKLFRSDSLDIEYELKPFDTIYLEAYSGFVFTEWRNIAEALNIIVGMFTLYIVLQR